MLIEDYEWLISEKNAQRTRFMEYVHAVLKQGGDFHALIQSIPIAFDLENAAGVQLDVIGSIVGISRCLNFTPFTGDRMMDDDEYRMFIRLQIAQNYWDGTNGSLIELYRNALPDMDIKYTDNQDMTISVEITGPFQSRQVEILLMGGYILAPAGVGLNIDVIVESEEIAEYMAFAVSGCEIEESVRFITRNEADLFMDGGISVDGMDLNDGVQILEREGE